MILCFPRENWEGEIEEKGTWNSLEIKNPKISHSYQFHSLNVLKNVKNCPSTCPDHVACLIEIRKLGKKEASCFLVSQWELEWQVNTLKNWNVKRCLGNIIFWLLLDFCVLICSNTLWHIRCGSSYLYFFSVFL